MEPDNHFPADFTQTSTALLGVLNADGIMRACNGTWRRVLGYTESDLRCGLYTELVHPDDLGQTEVRLEQLQQNQSHVTFTNRMHRINGSYLPVLWQMNLGASGEIHMVGITLDQETAKPASSARVAADSQEFAAMLIHTAPVFFVAMSPLGRIIMMNDKLTQALGYPWEDLVGQFFIASVVSSGHQDMAQAALQGVAAQKTANACFQAAIVDHQGVEREVEWHFNLTHNVEGWEQYLFGVGIDIQDHQDAQRQRKLFQSIVEASSEAISVSTLDGRLRYWNGAHATLFQSAANAEEASFSYSGHCADAGLQRLEQEVLPRLRAGKTWEGILEMQRATPGAPATFPVWGRFDTIRNADGAPEYYFALMHDVSAEQKMQAELNFERDQYETIFHAAPMMILYKDKNCHVIRANQYAKDLIGHNPETRQPAEVLMESTDQYYQDDLEVIRTGQSRLGIIERSRGRYFQTDKIPYRNHKNEIAGVIVFAVDITNYLETRKTLHDNQTQLQKIQQDCTEGDMLLAGVLRHIQVGIGITDRHGRFVYVNDACSRLFGRTQEEMLQQRFISLFPPNDYSTMLRRYFSFVTEPEGATFIDRRQAARNGGQEFELRFTAHCLKWNEGEVFVLWMLEPV